MAHDGGKDHTGGIRRNYTGTHPRSDPFRRPGGTYPRDDISRPHSSMPCPHSAIPYSRVSTPRRQSGTPRNQSGAYAQSDPRASGVSRNGGNTAHNGGRTAPVPRSFREALFPFDENRSLLNRRAFLLGLFFACVYALAFAVFNMPLNVLTARFPPFAAEFVRTILPAATGTGVCTLSWAAFPRERRMMPFAFRSLTRLSVISFVLLQLLLWGESDAQWTVADFFARFVLAPLVTGQGISLWLFYRHWKRLTDAQPQKS